MYTNNTWSYIETMQLCSKSPLTTAKKKSEGSKNSAIRDRVCGGGAEMKGKQEKGYYEKSIQIWLVNSGLKKR